MKLVILDRDGVINHDSANYIKSPEEWSALPGSLEAISLLNKAGIKVVIATNQSGVFRKLFSEETLGKIHQKMKDQLAEIGGHIDAIYYCPHSPENICACRKPEPGMLLKALKDFDMAASDTCFAGDSIKDIQAAQTVGCKAVLVETGNGKKTMTDHSHAIELENTEIYKDLFSFTQALLVKDKVK